MSSKLNCISCGKFTSRTTDGAVCPKCDSVTHRTCAGIGPRAKVLASWRCAACQATAPKGRDPSTPVRCCQDTSSVQELPVTSIEPVTLVNAVHLTTTEPTDAETQLNLRPLKEEFTADVMKMHEAYMTELKSFRGEFRTHCSEMQELKAELSTLRATVEACNERAAEVERRMAHLEQAQAQKENSTLQAFELTIADLKAELNNREQEAYLNDVEVSGIPEEKGENPPHLVSVLGAAMGMTLDERDIVSAERVGAVARPRSGEASSQATIKSRRIIVRFARRFTQDEYLRAARVRRGLTSTDVGVSSTPPVRVYVNERLSRGNRHLFAKAREACRHHQWKYCWTKAGHVHVRKEHGSIIMHIRSERDLDRVFGNSSV